MRHERPAQLRAAGQSLSKAQAVRALRAASRGVLSRSELFIGTWAFCQKAVDAMSLTVLDLVDRWVGGAERMLDFEDRSRRWGPRERASRLSSREARGTRTGDRNLHCATSHGRQHAPHLNATHDLLRPEFPPVRQGRNLLERGGVQSRSIQAAWENVSHTHFWFPFVLLYSTVTTPNHVNTWERFAMQETELRHGVATLAEEQLQNRNEQSLFSLLFFCREQILMCARVLDR